MANSKRQRGRTLRLIINLLLIPSLDSRNYERFLLAVIGPTLSTLLPFAKRLIRTIIISVANHLVNTIYNHNHYEKQHDLNYTRANGKPETVPSEKCGVNVLLVVELCLINVQIKNGEKIRKDCGRSCREHQKTEEKLYVELTLVKCLTVLLLKLKKFYARAIL